MDLVYAQSGGTVIHYIVTDYIDIPRKKRILKAWKRGTAMPDYEKMYAILCAASSDALDALPETAENAAGRALLQAALDEAEELYIDAEE